MKRGDWSSVLQSAQDRGDAPETIAFPRASRQLTDMVGSAHRILVVASARTVRSVAAIRDLLDRGAHLWDMVQPNPTAESARRLSAHIDGLLPDVVVAVGGGSTIDLAKAGRLLSPHAGSLAAGLAGQKGALRQLPPVLIAVPTTAGTGSEMTPFATLYHRGVKVSLDVPGSRPDLAVLDGELVRLCPPIVRVATHFDALCHAIESTWSRQRSPRSRTYATSALEILVKPEDDLLSREAVPIAVAQDRLAAAALAGLAIAQTRTTAAHAFSYHLTTRHGIAHGFACAVSLVWLARYNWDAADEPLRRLLLELGCQPGASQNTPVGALNGRLRSAIRDGLVRFPILTEASLTAYIDAGLALRARADRNPVTLTAGDVRPYIEDSGMLSWLSAPRAMPVSRP